MHNRKSLQIYFHCVVIKNHSTFLYLDHKMNKSRGYVSGVLSTNYFETIARLFKRAAQIFGVSSSSLIRALRKSHIRPALRLNRTNIHKKKTRLDQTSRNNIKKRIFSIIRSHNIYQTNFSNKLHPHKTSHSFISLCILYYSRDSIINEISLILKALKEPPQKIKQTLYHNKMGKYYPLLIQKLAKKN